MTWLANCSAVLILALLANACSPTSPNPATPTSTSGGGSSEVGNGGDPTYYRVAHGKTHALLVLERVQLNPLPRTQENSAHSGSAIFLSERIGAMRTALAEAPLQWQQDLPAVCHSRTWACVYNGTIYLSVVKTPSPLTYQDAAFTLIHEAVHLVGERRETIANGVTELVRQSWAAQGHPETPHWQGLSKAPTAHFGVNEDRHFLRHQYTDIDAGNFYVWDDKRVQIYDPRQNTWAHETAIENPLQWIRGKQNRGEYAQQGIWLGSIGFVFVPCYTNYPKLGGGSATRLNLEQKTWQAVPAAAAPSPRRQTGLSKTGGRLVLWGGLQCKDFAQSLGDGAVYDPASNSYTSIPSTLPNTPLPRHGHGISATNTGFVVWGGFSISQSPGERGRAESLGDGGFYHFASATEPARWERILPGENSPSARSNPEVHWTGTELLVFGGRANYNEDSLTDGALYNPVSKTWRKIPTPEFQLKYGIFDNPLSFWTGSSFAIVTASVTAFFDPFDQRWVNVGIPAIPRFPNYGRLYWSGLEALVWDPEERQGFRLFP